MGGYQTILEFYTKYPQMASRPFYRNSLQVNIVVSWASEIAFSKTKQATGIKGMFHHTQREGTLNFYLYFYVYLIVPK